VGGCVKRTGAGTGSERLDARGPGVQLQDEIRTNARRGHGQRRVGQHAKVATARIYGDARRCRLPAVPRVYARGAAHRGVTTAGPPLHSLDLNGGPVRPRRGSRDLPAQISFASATARRVGPIVFDRRPPRPESRPPAWSSAGVPMPVVWTRAACQDDQRSHTDRRAANRGLDEVASSASGAAASARPPHRRPSRDRGTAIPVAASISRLPDD